MTTRTPPAHQPERPPLSAGERVLNWTIVGFTVVILSGTAAAGWGLSGLRLYSFAKIHIGGFGGDYALPGNRIHHLREGVAAWGLPLTVDGAAFGLTLIIGAASAVLGLQMYMARVVLVGLTGWSAWINSRDALDKLNGAEPSVPILDWTPGQAVAAMVPVAAWLLFEMLVMFLRVLWERRTGQVRARIHPLRFLFDWDGTWAIIRARIMGIPTGDDPAPPIQAKPPAPTPVRPQRRLVPSIIGSVRAALRSRSVRVVPLPTRTVPAAHSRTFAPEVVQAVAAGGGVLDLGFWTGTGDPIAPTPLTSPSVRTGAAPEPAIGTTDTGAPEAPAVDTGTAPEPAAPDTGHAAPGTGTETAPTGAPAVPAPRTEHAPAAPGTGTGTAPNRTDAGAPDGTEPGAHHAPSAPAPNGTGTNRQVNTGAPDTGTDGAPEPAGTAPSAPAAPDTDTGTAPAGAPNRTDDTGDTEPNAGTGTAPSDAPNAPAPDTGTAPDTGAPSAPSGTGHPAPGTGAAPEPTAPTAPEPKVSSRTDTDRTDTGTSAADPAATQPMPRVVPDAMPGVVPDLKAQRRRGTDRRRGPRHLAPVSDTATDRARADAEAAKALLDDALVLIERDGWCARDPLVVKLKAQGHRFGNAKRDALWEALKPYRELVESTG